MSTARAIKRAPLRRRPPKHHAVKAKPPAFHTTLQTDTAAPEIAGQPPPDRYLLRKSELLDKIGLSFPAIWRKIQLGQFPEPVEIGGKVAWYADEVEAWLNSLPRRSYKKAGV